MTTTRRTINFADAVHNYFLQLDAPPAALDACSLAEWVRAVATLGTPQPDNANVAMYGDEGTTPGTAAGGVRLLLVCCPPNLLAADEMVIAHDAQPAFSGGPNMSGVCYALLWLPAGPFGERDVEITG